VKADDDAEVSAFIKLKSKQEEIFEVERDVACRSVTVKNMVRAMNAVVGR